MQRRETTKIEDMAYCLLGILGVYMPLVYGEGGHAWVRLEDEVSKKHKTAVNLPRPNALDNRNSGQDFPFWFQPIQATQSLLHSKTTDDMTISRSTGADVPHEAKATTGMIVR